MRITVFIFLFFVINFSHAQESGFLLSKLKKAQSDTQKINLLNTLTKIYLDVNIDSAAILNKQAITIGSKKENELYSYKGISNTALIYRKKRNLDLALKIAQTALSVAKKHVNLSEQANAHNLLGTIYEQQNKYDSASYNFIRALKLSQIAKDKNEILSSYLHLGIYYKKIDNVTNSLFNLLEAMKISEEVRDSSILFTISINLGTLYERTLDHAKAMACYNKALYIAKKNPDKDEDDLAISYFKIGKLYQSLEKIDSAKYYLNETLKIHLKRNDTSGLIFDYSNIASFEAKVGDFVNAEKNYNKAIGFALANNDSLRLNMIYSYLGQLNFEKKDYNKAIKNYHTALLYLTNLVSKETIMLQYYKMSEIYRIQKKYKEALDYYILYKKMSDSSINMKETKKQTELKLNYEFEKTQKKIEEETKAKELISQAELEQERKQRNYLLFGIGLISLMLIITIKNVKAKQKANSILQKQKLEIERQKKIVEEKNHEINDSINYALRIQTASIPKLSELNTFFKNYDFFFNPKDVVSGDFYWAERTTDFSLIAVGDCTGHGVPGAITSMIGSMLLNEIFNVKKIYQPNEVLTELNRLVKLTLRQDSQSLTNDGMDIAFCTINYQSNDLLYAGANRPLYVINSKGEFKEYKPTKMSVGGQVPLIQDYQLHSIQLQKGDTIVLSTDGYADQFGGAKEKKMTSKAFRNLLTQNHHLPANELKQVIENNYNTWKSSYEQTDDVLVFILKV